MYSHDNSDSLSMQRRMDEQNKEKKMQRKKKSGPQDIEVSHPEDEAEKEAEQVARKVVDGQSGGGSGDGNVERKSNSVYAKHDGDPVEPGGDFEQMLSASKGGGELMDDNTRGEMEEKMGGDFSKVKIHRSKESNDMAQQINALAFTDGEDIHFAEGKYDTSSSEGKELLAHELTHTQQNTSGSLNRKIHRSLENPEEDQVESAVTDYYDQLERVFDSYQETLDTFLLRMKTPTKQEVNKEFAIGLIKGIFELGSTLKGIFTPSVPGETESVWSLLGPIGTIIEAFLKKQEGKENIELADFYELNKKIWTKAANIAAGKKRGDIDATLTYYRTIHGAAPELGTDYLQALQGRADHIKTSLADGGDYSFEALMADHAVNWVKLQTTFNSVGKPTGGYIQVSLNSYWNVTGSTIESSFASRIANILSTEYDDNVPVQSLGIPIRIRYKATSGKFIKAWVNEPTPIHQASEVKDDGSTDQDGLNELKEYYANEGVPNVDKFHFKIL